jgi:hypothetical protein
VRDAEDKVIVADRQEFLLAGAQPLLPGIGLALWTVTIPTGNGELSITCLMVSDSLWGVCLPKGHAVRTTCPFDSPLRLGFQKCD